MKIQKIAVGVDFSEESENALAQSACLAKRFGAEVVLMHVGPVALPGTGSVIPSVRVWEQIVDQRATEDRVKVKVLAQKLMQDGLKASHFTVEGEPGEELAKASDALEIDLLVVGTQGLTGAQHFLLGSVAQQVVRRAHCNVLVARKGADWGVGPKRILVATDFSAHAEEALRSAIELAADNAIIEVLHFWNAPVPAAPIAGHASGELSLATLSDELEKDANDCGAALVAKLHDSRVQLRFEAHQGPPAPGLIRRAKQEEGHYDLVALGSHGRRGFKRFFLGSVAEKVLRHAPCSTLVVHREEDRDLA